MEGVRLLSRRHRSQRVFRFGAGTSDRPCVHGSVQCLGADLAVLTKLECHPECAPYSALLSAAVSPVRAD